MHASIPHITAYFDLLFLHHTLLADKAGEPWVKYKTKALYRDDALAVAGASAWAPMGA